MSDQTPSNLRRIFELALATPNEERESVLSRECGGDENLRRRVLTLLEIAEKEDSPFLASPTIETPHAGSDAATIATMLNSPSAAEELTGAQIGAYRIIEHIGEGGFGRVFLAEQLHPVVRKVALKIIKLGMDTRQVVARFEQERQALALLDHPHIAKVLDAGATPAGRPYFVMEYCAGEQITAYCDKKQLSIAERLPLFIQVCQAIQHAHQKGLIHRDIKPSNVLVTTQDGRPFAKVIDFGVAKATDDKLTEKTIFTEHRQLIGTPEYMSPEQAEGSLDIDTRTDVYALGVLLYELLSGATPFDGRELRSKAYAEIQRIIREQDPPKPSTRFSQLHDTIASVAARRSAEPKRLSTLLRGELDWIVMKSLEKDRLRRYESASGLAGDVQRYIDREPVSAAPPSSVYRTKKFIRRNKGPVSAATAIGLALIIGAAGFAWQATIARQERNAAVAARQSEAQRAESEEKARAAAEAINAFVLNALKASDPYEGGVRDVTIAAAMDDAVRTLDLGEFKEQPQIEAGLRATIGNIYLNNAKYSAAETQLMRAVAISEASIGKDSPEVADALRDLAMIYREQKKFAEAEPAIRRSLSIREAAGDSSALAESMQELGALEYAQGKFTQAEATFARSLDLRRALPQLDPPLLADSLTNLGAVKQELAKFAEAEPLLLQAVELDRKHLGENHPGVATRLNNLAMLYRAAGRFKEVEVALQKSLSIFEESLGQNHPEVANAVNNLGAVLAAVGRRDEAEQLYLRSLKIREELYGPDHPTVAQCLNNLGDTYYTTGRFKEAETAWTRALALYEKHYGPDDLRSTQAAGNLALALTESKQFDLAEKMHLRVLQAREKSLGPDHPSVGRANYSLGDLYLRTNRPALAEPRFERAVSAFHKSAPNHPSLGLYLSALGLSQQQQGKHAEARVSFDEALACMRRDVPEGSSNFALVLYRSANARIETKPPDMAAALREFEAAVEMARKILKPDHPRLKQYQEGYERCRTMLAATTTQPAP